MKKGLMILSCLFLFVGCDMLTNTPTKKTEEFLKKYQDHDQEVTDQLDTMVLSDTTLDTAQTQKYKEILKRQYEDMDYNIKEENIDGNDATVEVEIEVYDLYGADKKSTTYKNTDPDDLKDETGIYTENLFTNFRLDAFSKETSRIKYTIIVSLTKVDGTWEVDNLTSEDLDKLHGIYDYE